MTEADIRARAIALYDRFTHEHHDRRAFMAELGAVAGGTTAASALLATIAADPAAATVVAADDARVKARRITIPAAGGRTLKTYLASPAKAPAKGPAILVIHENRGLNAHIEDIARRVALAGYSALAADFLTSAGGTPADEDKARTLIGGLDLGAAVADGVAALNWLRKAGHARIGAVGFCWGGAMINRLAVAAGSALDAGVGFYGPAPAPAEATKVQAPLLLHFAGIDERVNATGLPWAAALKAAGKRVESHVYPGVNHAFNNDTAVGRYDPAAAALAWQRTIDFFAKTLR
jgi:carboxymethylenebutenolidase